MKKIVLFVALSMCLSACTGQCPETPAPACACPAAADNSALSCGAPGEAGSLSASSNLAKTPIPAGEAEIVLPAPNAVEVSLTESLKNRRSVRAYTDEMISLEQLSALLWSANGINREDGKRTAPSAMNKQSVSIYVTMEKGAYKYDAANSKLTLVSSEDVRPVKLAPVELVLTSFYESDVIRGLDVGVVTQNVALYSSATGLATVIRMFRSEQKESIDAVKTALKLDAKDQPVCNMAIGYEAK